MNYLTAFSVVVKELDEKHLPKLAQVDGKANGVDNDMVMMELFQLLSHACPSIAQVLPKQIFTMLDCCREEKSLAELMEALSASSRRTFVRQIVNPFMEANLIELTYPDNPRHPQQKYVLAEEGVAWLKRIEEVDKG